MCILHIAHETEIDNSRPGLLLVSVIFVCDIVLERYNRSMALTLSHSTALHATRVLRSNRIDLASLDRGSIAHPAPWLSKRWTKRNFTPDEWNWQQPRASQPLDILVNAQESRPRTSLLRTHVCSIDLPLGSIIWLDEHTTMPSPPFLFTQMAEHASVPALVLLGHELCGHFSRYADNPVSGPIIDGIPAATSVADIATFLDQAPRVAGNAKARTALSCIADHALSVMESILSCIYALPPKESGFGMGPIALNRRVEIANTQEAGQTHARYPDILFPFAPIGINYDGEGHLDLEAVANAAREAALADAETKQQKEQLLSAALYDVRAKAVDDIRRNRELAANGYLVLPATKEDLYDWGALDNLTRQILACARETFGVDTSRYEKTLDNTDLARDRYALLTAMLPAGTTPSGRSEII